jgi:hypothetical protein
MVVVVVIMVERADLVADLGMLAALGVVELLDKEIMAEPMGVNTTAVAVAVAQVPQAGLVPPGAMAEMDYQAILVVHQPFMQVVVVVVGTDRGHLRVEAMVD